MGEIRAKVLLENNDDLALAAARKLARRKVRAVEIDAVVDTGAVLLLLPQDVVEALGLQKMGTAIVQLANDQKIEMVRAGTLRLTVAGRTMPIDCLVGPPGCEALVGQIVMESLDLIADPLKRTLTPRPESPFLPTLKLKRALAAA
jgi:predicted aspartyl protease